MNLNELSQKLEDHLTDQDIQDAQELLDSTYQEIVDMRGELVEAQAELSALRTQAIADAAEIERLDQCIGELRLELSKCQERNDELCIASHNQTVKISKIRKVINEN